MIERFGSLNNNKNKIKSILGEKFLNKSYTDNLTVDDFYEANDKISSFCYGEEFNRLLQKRKLNSINDIYNDYLGSLKLEELKKIDSTKLGLLVVRPEVYYYRKMYKTFLEERNLKIVYEKKVKLDFKQYLLLYYNSIILKDTIYDFPSRTFNYIDNDCYLYVVNSNNKENVSHYLYSIKGKQGKYDIGTIRGNISYKLLKRNIHEGNFIKEAIIPLDPIGAGRMLTRDVIPHDGSHNIANIPLLFYAGQSIHVPNNEEFTRDLKTLCNNEEIETILKKVR